MRRNLDKKTYREKCRILARKVARQRMEPKNVSTWLSKQKWFMQLSGVHERRGKIVLSKKGAVALFGKEWCDQCWIEELIRTGVYEPQEPQLDPEDPNQMLPYKLKDKKNEQSN